MHSLKRIFVGLTLLTVASGAMAQVDNLPVKTVNGKQFHYYVVQPKETIYSLCRDLGVDKRDVERYNPSVADGLKAGQILYFPVDNPEARMRHTVQDKETLYGIGRKYNVTVEQLKEWNPDVRDGIRPGQTIYVSSAAGVNTADVSPAPQPQPQQSAPVAVEPESGTYTIHDGESLYRIAVNHSTTVDAILALNPGLDRNNYKAGTVIRLPETSTAEVAEVSKPVVEASTMPVNPPVSRVEPEPVAVTPETSVSGDDIVTTRYEVGKHETFYSIARKHGITVEDLEKANPTVGILKEGMVLSIPVQVAADNMDTAAENGETIPGEGNLTTETDPTMAAVTAPAEVNIALMLPLMLEQEQQAKQAQLYTEFYKGFLLAVDSLRDCGTPIHVQTYDTGGSSERVREILANPALKSASVIVAPDSEAHLSEIGRWCADNGVYALNLFVVKDDSYLSNPMMLQGNIPHADMYRKAINGITGRFSRYKPVILSRKGGPDDKSEYITALKQELDAKGVEYSVVEFDGTMRLSDLEGLDTNGRYAFIPASGRQAELNRIAPALIEWSRGLTDPDPIRLFGYPEWTTFRGETLVNMHKLNTLVYSRFYTVPEDPSVRSVEDQFTKWYGAPMQNFVPRQGLFGFDTGMFLINSLRGQHMDGQPLTPYVGVQNGFNFVKSYGSAGWVNDELYFINFRPSGLIDKIAL